MLKDIRPYLLSVLLLPASVSGAQNSGGTKSHIEYKVQVEKSYPHDRNAYTQGLFFYDGQMYESTGQWGESSFRKTDLATGKVLSVTNYPGDVFVEGSCVVGGYLFVLTWTNHVCYMYELATMNKVAEFKNPGEGWGLTTDGKSLIMSDGSSRLFFINPASFTRVKSLEVTLEGKPIRNLNELEYIDGKVWANVYLTDKIVIINPGTGVVEAVIDCTGLLPQNLRTPKTDVLNGIAYDSRDGGIYITGKNWPRLYRVSLKEKGTK